MAKARVDSLKGMGERVRVLRFAYSRAQGKQKPVSQSEMARRTGTTVSAWNNIERGLNRIGVDNAMAVCRLTGASLDYIYFGQKAGLPYALAVEIEKLEIIGTTAPVAKRA